MRKIIISIFSAILFVAGANAQSRVEELSLSSEILGTEKSYSVYIPDGYDASKDNYPVLYLLHGAFGQNTDWHTHGDLQRQADEEIAAGRVRPMLIVMPDARGAAENKAGENMGYFNVAGWDYEDFFFKEFIPHIDSRFRTVADKDGRAIAGLSMGGGGSVVYAQRHPDTFSAVYSVSGLLDKFPKNGISKSYAVPFLWSVVETSPVVFLQNASQEQIEQLRTVRWMADCGDTDFLIRPNLDFFSEMMRCGIPMEFRVRDGAHSWQYWTSAVPMILQFTFGKE